MSLVPPTRIPDPDLGPLNDEPFLVETIASVTGSDPHTIRNRLEREKTELGANVAESLAAWGLEPYEWSERLNDFYSQTDGFLFETLVWNRHPAKVQMRQWIAEYLAGKLVSPQTILTYGDGLGIDSLFLASAGHQPDYFEVSGQCVEFSLRLAQRMNTKLRVLQSTQEIAANHYDVVVCLDVLEHVPDPPALVGKLVSYLKPGGKLIVHAPFWFIHPSVATHLKANRRFSGDWTTLYQPHGLQLVDGRFLWAPIVLEKTAAGQQVAPMPLQVRVRLALGAIVLKSARYWSWPLSCLARQTLKRTQ